MTTYRVGNHQPQNVYRGDQYIGVMFTADDAALVVQALNGCSWTAADLDGARQRARERAADFAEFVDHGAWDECAEHRPSSLGYGLGYGPCAGCGELWPCRVSRSERTLSTCEGCNRGNCPRHGAVS